MRFVTTNRAIKFLSDFGISMGCVGYYERSTTRKVYLGFEFAILLLEKGFGLYFDGLGDEVLENNGLVDCIYFEVDVGDIACELNGLVGGYCVVGDGGDAWLF
ncbi:hypothetical protein GH714_013678 [Hevea brasiliensis]|uniref:Uncharacterized protein n=1 Tax=Hevea brasiliensis TaxID=3981 RepID=A0A6A6M4W7_HEVBR|nr:hypothetical protein GH714_013678 [Hevea brasiliensis]